MRGLLFSGLAFGLGIHWLAGAPPYDALYAFGDSLTDTGREPAEAFLHYDGRWSNGPLWVEYLSVRLGFPYNPSNNFAHSGAQTDDTFGQVADFVPANIDQSLFVVWAGGNDFLQEYDRYWFNDAGWDRQIAYSVGNLSNAVIALYSKGARFILVPNTVDVTGFRSSTPCRGSAAIICAVKCSSSIANWLRRWTGSSQRIRRSKCFASIFTAR